VKATVRQSDVAYVLAKLRICGTDHLLLRAHGKWGDWSLVGGHVEPTDHDWRAAACREVQEEMPPLRCGTDVEVVELGVATSEWGPVASRSAGGAPTHYRACWYLLRFLSSPLEVLSRIESEQFLLVPLPELEQFQPLSAVVTRAADLLDDWQHLPLSWDADLPYAPLHTPEERTSRHAAG
jgi:hypothetical protein